MTIHTKENKSVNFQSNLKLVGAELENGSAPVLGREQIREGLAKRLDQQPTYEAVLKGFAELSSAAKKALKDRVEEVIQEESPAEDPRYVLKVLEIDVAAAAGLEVKDIAATLRDLRKPRTAA
jgi:hypothetical protein